MNQQFSQAFYAVWQTKIFKAIGYFKEHLDKISKKKDEHFSKAYIQVY